MNRALEVDRRPLHRFGVDAIVGAGAFGEPERVPPLTPVDIPGLPQADYVAAGMPSQVADKLQGILRPSAGPLPGSRSTATSSACDLSAAAGQRTAEAPTWPHRPLAPVDALRRACGCTEPRTWWD